jgi:hypothetical protein
MAPMPNESYFMAFAGLGLSLAGFAGLISAIAGPRAASNAAVAAYRIRAIVVLGFCLTFAGLGTVAGYAVTGDLGMTVRIGSLLMAVPFLRGLLIDTRPGPVWENQRERQSNVAGLLVLLAACLANVAVANEAALQVLLLLGLIGPTTIFYNTIKDATGQGNEKA